ncbi:hypothetical protein HGRIS_013615 [Hohenbuehelia grisea]|uniref:Phosphatidylinositol-specific phospholipase C X domain-containing protein n=1 Tax=Hohenbuehelia grisea TaxID=104357 RepID=A0ABR3IWC5_9AGAR
MQFIVANLTDKHIAILESGGAKAHTANDTSAPLVVSPQVTETFTPKHPKNIVFAQWDPTDASKEAEFNVNTGGFALQFSMMFGASWQPMKLPEECPWRIYTVKLSRKIRKLVVLSRRDLSKFLSDLPDSLRLSSLALPGTHDSMAFYGWPVSQCQSLSTSLAVQLAGGIRVLDVRFAVVDGRLISYHGVYPQRTPFLDILSTIRDFLTSSPRETIVMSIKQEDYTRTTWQNFSALVRDEISTGPGGKEMWFFENRIPKLGEVRGKVVLLSRFGGNGDGWEGGLEGLGIHPTSWPDSEKSGFTWNCKDTLVRTHDWYNIPSFLSIPEKVALSTQILLPPPNNPPMPVLSITYFSAASFPLAFPPTIAHGFGWPKAGLGVEGVNSRIGKWLLDQLGSDVERSEAPAASEKEKQDFDGPSGVDDVRIRGWAFMDFYAEPENAVVPLLVECNHRGRRSGEEGW